MTKYNKLAYTISHYQRLRLQSMNKYRELKSVGDKDYTYELFKAEIYNNVINDLKKI